MENETKPISETLIKLHNLINESRIINEKFNERIRLARIRNNKDLDINNKH